MTAEQRERLEDMTAPLARGLSTLDKIAIQAALADLDAAQRHVADLKAELDAVYASRAALTQRLDEYQRAVWTWAYRHRHQTPRTNLRESCAALFALAERDGGQKP